MTTTLVPNLPTFYLLDEHKVQAEVIRRLRVIFRFWQDHKLEANANFLCRVATFAANFQTPTFYPAWRLPYTAVAKLIARARSAASAAASLFPKSVPAPPRREESNRRQGHVEARILLGYSKS